MSLHRTYLVFSLKLIIVVLVLMLISSHNYVIGGFIEPKDRVYGYRMDLTRIGITPKYISVIDRSRVVVAGTVSGIYGVAVLNIANPYSDPVVEDLYPLTGVPTYMTTDGHPLTRIAVSSDKGEILVFKVDKGRITKHLYIVLGADFYIDKVFLARDKAGTIKIIAFVIEGGARGYPCMNCHIYVLDEEAKGIIRIGPRTGNATVVGKELEGTNVQFVAPLAVYGAKGFYWDASNTLVAYVPQVVKLVLNITYIDERAGEQTPLPNTLVEVLVAPEGARERIVYGINADLNGIARIPVPIERDRISIVNLTIRSTAGVPIWSYVYTVDPKQLERILMTSDEIPLPPAILNTKYVDTRPAVRVYGIPPFLFIKLDLIDLTPAPLRCLNKGSANFLLSPSITDLHFIKGEDELKAKIVYADPSAGNVGMIVARVDKGVVRDNHIIDYVGIGMTIVSSITYTDGSYTVLGLADGRIRVYSLEGGIYRLRNIYALGSHLLDLIAIPGVKGYIYVAVTSKGLQVFRIEPYPLPIFRNLASLYLATPGYVHGDALSDLTAVTLVDHGGVMVIKNINLVVGDGTALTIDKFMARDIDINIDAPRGEDINGTIVIFRYPGGYSRYRLTSPKLTLRNIIPNIDYMLEIYPPKDYIHNSVITFRLSEDMSIRIIESTGAVISVDNICCRLAIEMRYREFMVTLRLLDEISGDELIAPVDIYINNRITLPTTRSNEHTIKLLYGVNTISILPSKGFEHIYRPLNITITVDSNMDVSLRIERVRYGVNIKIVDGVTGLAPIAPLEVELGNEVYTLEAGTQDLKIVLPYGNHTMVIRPAKGYEDIYTLKEFTISVMPKTLRYIVEMHRKIYRVEVRIKDPYTLDLVAPIDIYINGSVLRSGVVKGIEVIDLPYGRWILRITPSKGYEKVYIASDLEIYICNNIKLEVNISRAIYTIAINIVDTYGKIISPLDIVIKGPVTIMQTIEPPTTFMRLSLPYGEYSLNIVPHNVSIYTLYATTLVVDSPRSIMITVQRVRYRLEVKVVDRFGVIGRFILYANGTEIARNIVREAVIDIPYGIYTLRLVPMPGWTAVYDEPRPIPIIITGDTSASIYVYRKLYRLRIAVMEGGTPIANAIAYIYSLESGELITSLITDANGLIETKVPYGIYKVVVRHEHYVQEEIPVLAVSSDVSEIVSLRPTIPTLLWRYMPVIGSLAGVGIVAYLILKIKAIIAKRLVEEETF